MEGPSLYLAAEQLAPFTEEIILKVGGNTTIGKERLIKQRIRSIFSFGKYLIFQFDSFALRVHFLMFGSYKAYIKAQPTAGSNLKKTGTPRLSLKLKSGQIDLYSCSVKFIEDSNVKSWCDFSSDIMSDAWDEKKALSKIFKKPTEEIGDVLLDQAIFAGVGNIIKNEVLFLTKTSPLIKIKNLQKHKIKEIVKAGREFVFKFYEWRKVFELKKHYQIYRQSVCKICGGKVTRKKTGARRRVSFICTSCQKS